MKEIKFNLSEEKVAYNNLHACIGYFDGIHLGHQKLMEKAIQNAKENRGLSAVITFEPDPWQIIKHMNKIPHLTSMQQRKQIAKEIGIDLWIVLEFTNEMANLSVEEFHVKILKKLALQSIVCGFDFRYGKEGKGDSNTLRKMKNLDVYVIEKISYNNQKISSTRIEHLIVNKQIEEANILLTRPYQIHGHVIYGKQNGKKIGFPTANLKPNANYIIPCKGVYVGAVLVKNNLYNAVINIGNNPTFSNDNVLSIEAHLFDMNDDIYNEYVIFEFYKWIREEKKFKKVEDLIQQLRQDCQICKQWYHSFREDR